MTVDCGQLVNSAKKLHANANCEADWRGVCARAYYSVFQDGSDFHSMLPTSGERTTKKKGMHVDLIERLESPSVDRSTPEYVKSRKLGHFLKTMYATRIKADYARVETITAADANTSIAFMDKVVSEIFGALPPSLPPGDSARPTLTRVK